MLESVLITLNGRNRLAEDINGYLQKLPVNVNTLDVVNIEKFSDGELCVEYINSVRGKRVYLLTSPRTSDDIMILNLAIDAAKRAAAKEIIPIIPCYPYQRSDKKDQKRGPIGSKVMSKMIEAMGATGIVLFDLHADQTQGLFEIPVTHLEGKNVFDSFIASIYDENTILASPDAGGGKRVERMQAQLLKYHNIDIDYVMMKKSRKKANVVDNMQVIGDVEGQHVIILDDMVDTAGTLCKAAEVLIENGATKVTAVISHGVLSGPAYERISESKLNELVISDSLEHNGGLKISTVSLAEQISLAITAIDSHTSYEGLKGKRF